MSTVGSRYSNGVAKTALRVFSPLLSIFTQFSGSGLLRWLPGDGRRARGQTQLHKHISGVNKSHLLTCYCSKQVTRPRPKSRDEEILSAHPEAVTRIDGKNWDLYSIYTATNSVLGFLGQKEGIHMLNFTYTLPDCPPEWLHFPPRVESHKGDFSPKPSPMLRDIQLLFLPA